LDRKKFALSIYPSLRSVNETSIYARDMSTNFCLAWERRNFVEFIDSRNLLMNSALPAAMPYLTECLAFNCKAFYPHPIYSSDGRRVGVVLPTIVIGSKAHLSTNSNRFFTLNSNDGTPVTKDQIGLMTTVDDEDKLLKWAAGNLQYASFLSVDVKLQKEIEQIRRKKGWPLYFHDNPWKPSVTELNRFQFQVHLSKQLLSSPVDLWNADIIKWKLEEKGKLTVRQVADLPPPSYTELFPQTRKKLPPAPVVSLAALAFAREAEVRKGQN